MAGLDCEAMNLRKGVGIKEGQDGEGVTNDLSAIRTILGGEAPNSQPVCLLSNAGSLVTSLAACRSCYLKRCSVLPVGHR